MFGLTLTTAGAAEVEAAYQSGTVVTITDAEIGDGDGSAVSDDPDVLAAATEVAGLFGTLAFSDSQPDEGLLNGQFVIDCREYPGRVLRAVGLRSSSGTLIAYGGYPDTFLPAQTDSIIKEVIITCVLSLNHAENVELLIDPNRRILTESVADDRYLNEDENLADVPDKATARNNLEIYSKTESDDAYQPKGNYAAAGSAYTKAESDARFEPLDSAYTKAESEARYQPKGSYAAAGSSYTKAESDARYEPLDSAYTKAESEARYQPKGSYAASGSSYTKAESDSRYLSDIRL
ncbi:hypothetical protein GTGU_00179, partial [Trabulsiella guamensis ATCC 49490]